MTPKQLNPIVYILFEAACFLLMGYFVFDKVIFDIETTGIYFSLFGIFLIVMFNLLEYRNATDFLIVGILLTIISVILFFENSDLLTILRNSLWFILLALGSFTIWRILALQQFRNLAFGYFSIFIIVGVGIYLFMTLFNVYIFRFYRLNEQIGFSFYITLAIKTGGILGFGIGLGYDLARLSYPKIEKMSIKHTQ